MGIFETGDRTAARKQDIRYRVGACVEGLRQYSGSGGADDTIVRGREGLGCAQLACAQRAVPRGQ